MSDNSPLFFWGLAGVVIIVILFAIAVYYLRQVQLMRRRQKENEQALQEAMQKRRADYNRSIQVIAQGILNDDLTLTEGAIRISNILDRLSVAGELREAYTAFDLLRSATAHIPILEAWKQLSTKEKMQFDRQRVKLETDHREFVVNAAQTILGREF